MIVGSGVDLVEVERVRRARARWGERFLRRLYTERELTYCARKKEPDGSLAARFAAKEAVAKTLGLGMGRFAWREIEVVSDPSGRPGVSLSGAALEVARSLGVNQILLSLSHTREHALAQALAVRKDAGSEETNVDGEGEA